MQDFKDKVVSSRVERPASAALRRWPSAAGALSS